MNDRTLKLLAVASASLGLAFAPLVARAQEEPGPLVPQTPTTLPTSAPNLPAAPGAPMLAPSTTIHPGDQLQIAVYGDPSLSQSATVQADGTISYPLVGQIPVAGKTPDEARATLATSLGRYLRHPQVTLAIAQSGQITVLVLGNIKSPGKYTVSSGARITEAIAAAGGIATMNGTWPIARVSENDGTLRKSDLQALLSKGDASQNVALTNNAIVYVTGAETIRVQVLGAVTRPGNVEVFQGDRLSTALARAGAEAQAKPDLNKITLTRKDPATGKAVSYQIDMYQALQHGDERYDPILQKDDLVYVPEARSINAVGIGLLGLLGHFLGF